MFTNNFYKIMTSTLRGDGALSGVQAVDYTGTRRNLYCYYSRAYSGMGFWTKMKTIYTSLNTASPCVCFGDGTTPPSKDDYKLSGNIISTITATVTQNTTSDEGVTVHSAVYNVSNTGSEPITITEIGMFGYWYYNSSGSSTYLLERTVLDTPVTIPAGGIGQVTYTIRMNYPTA